MNWKALLAAFLLLNAVEGAALAEPACKPEQVKKPPTLSEMYSVAEQRAKAWRPDAVVAQISNTMLGYLQSDGSAASWHLLFYSDSAKSTVAIDTFRGALNCSAEPGSGGRIPNLKPDFFRDSAKLYAIAKQNGGSFLSEGYGVMIGTAAAPSTRHATWNITFNKDGKDSGVLVLVDANTGVVENVIK